jgi:hypothetical protein
MKIATLPIGETSRPIFCNTATITIVIKPANKNTPTIGRSALRMFTVALITVPSALSTAPRKSVIGARPKKATIPTIAAIKERVIQKIGFARILRIRSRSSSWWLYSFHPTHGSFLGFPSLFYGDGIVAKHKGGSNGGSTTAATLPERHIREMFL